jgi:hypothetical protein
MNVVDQLANNTGHVYHVAVRPTPARTSPGVVGNPPTHQPTPTHEFPGLSKKNRVFVGSSPGVWKVEGRFLKFHGVFGSSPGVLGNYGYGQGSSP